MGAIPIAGAFYHGDPKDSASQAKYYYAKGKADGRHRQELSATDQIAEYFGRGYDDGKRLGRSMRNQSIRPIPADATSWTPPQKTIYSLGFRHGEAAQARAEIESRGWRLPARPNQLPPTSRAAANRLAGAFRTIEPVTRKQEPPWFYQFEFGNDGTAVFLTVDGSGRPAGTPPVKGWFTVNDTTLVFRPHETEGPLLYSLLTFMFDGETLRFMNDERIQFSRTRGMGRSAAEDRRAAPWTRLDFISAPVVPYSRP
jgi:hypothetical protein